MAKSAWSVADAKQAALSEVRGTQGYSRFASAFVASSQSLQFNDVCGDFVPFLPAGGGRVLDAGAGTGQNAAALAQRGYSVVAVEPLEAFLAAARAAYSDLPIDWLNGSLPSLECLELKHGRFELILIIGVWHHLDCAERVSALVRLASLLTPGGVCALTLRNGPAGMGTHVHDIDIGQTVMSAEVAGLQCVYRREDQPSILRGKPGVSWGRIVLKKP